MKCNNLSYLQSLNQERRNMAADFKYDIVEEIGVLSENAKG